MAYDLKYKKFVVIKNAENELNDLQHGEQISTRNLSSNKSQFFRRFRQN
jgi:hypothetical protein